MNEKKYKLELEKLTGIINKLRNERNDCLVKYQRINADINEFKNFIIEFSKLIKNDDFEEKSKNFKNKFSKYF